MMQDSKYSWTWVRCTSTRCSRRPWNWLWRSIAWGNPKPKWHGSLWKVADIYPRQSLSANLKYNWSIPTCQMERKIVSEGRGVKISHIDARKWLFARSLHHIQEHRVALFLFFSVLKFHITWVSSPRHPSFPLFTPHPISSCATMNIFKYPLFAQCFILSWRSREK